MNGVEFAQVNYTVDHGHSLLRGISLSLEAETTTAVLGRSGSGKTTLLRMVNGLVMPTSGTVRVQGRATAETDLIALRRSIGYVIQETGLFPHMTIERNVALPLELAGQSHRQSDPRVAEVLSLVGMDLASFGARYPWQLSGGQRQRAGLARALAADPQILLMDEPLGALDPITRAELQTMLRSLMERLRKTVLLVTHDLNEALYLAQRIVFLESGEIVADLPAAEVLHSLNPHVQGYVQAVRGQVSA